MLGQLFRAWCEHVRPTGNEPNHTHSDTLTSQSQPSRRVIIVIVAEREEREDKRGKSAREKRREKRREGGKPLQRLRVCVQDASVCTGETPACVEHAGVFPVHTEASWTHTRRRFWIYTRRGFPHAKPHHTTPPTEHTTPQHNVHTTTPKHKAHIPHTLSAHTPPHTPTPAPTHTHCTHTTHTNAWTRARRANNLETKKWMLGYVHGGQPTMIMHSIKIWIICNNCNFMRTLLFLELINKFCKNYFCNFFTYRNGFRIN